MSQYEVTGPINVDSNGVKATDFVLTYKGSSGLYYASTYLDECDVPRLFMDLNPGISSVTSAPNTNNVLVFEIAGSSSDKLQFLTTYPGYAQGGLSTSGTNNIAGISRDVVPQLSADTTYASWGPPSLLLSSAPYSINKTLGDAKIPLVFELGNSINTVTKTCTATGNQKDVPLITGTTNKDLIPLPLMFHFKPSGTDVCESPASENLNSVVCNSYCYNNPGASGCTANDCNHFPAFSNLQDCEYNYFYTYCADGKYCGDSSCKGPCSQQTNTCEFNTSDRTFSCKFDSNKFIGSTLFWILIGVGGGLLLILIIVIIYLIIKHARG